MSHQRQPSAGIVRDLVRPGDTDRFLQGYG
jgi:hypothetical protein